VTEYEYPTEKQLETIRNWNFEKGFKSLAKYVESLWWTPSWGFKLSRGKTHLFSYQVIKLQLHTGGWSGNESIISALQQNLMFWSLCFYMEITGGHYWFDIRKDMWEPTNSE